jgi:hypothetical protein
MKKLIILLALTLPVSARTYTYSGTNQYGTPIDVEITNTNGNLRGYSYNYETGYSQEIEFNQPSSGLSGSMFDYGSGRYTDVNIDSYGNTDLWEY